jgi:hypothetical protein
MLSFVASQLKGKIAVEASIWYVSRGLSASLNAQILPAPTPSTGKRQMRACGLLTDLSTLGTFVV